MHARVFIGLSILIAVMLGGCVGSLMHSSLKYGDIQRMIKRHNSNLLDMQIGMTQDEMRHVMGDPESSEAYSWGSVWLYRTAMTSGIYGTADTDFTPIVLGSSGQVQGWGRNYFKDRVRRYELTLVTNRTLWIP